MSLTGAGHNGESALDKFDLRESFEMEVIQSMLSGPEKNDNGVQKEMIQKGVNAVNEYFAEDKGAQWIHEVVVLDMRTVFGSKKS